MEPTVATSTPQRVPSDVFDLGVALAANRAQQAAMEAERESLADSFIGCMLALQFANRIDDLADAMRGFKHVYGPGWVKRSEAAGLPGLRALNATILNRCNDGEGRWRGPFPLRPEAPRPRRGTWVVYQLLDSEGAVIYIGSSGGFVERLNAHKYSKEFTGWRASRCEDEQSCRDLETALIDAYRPPLNRMIPKPRVELRKQADA